MCVCDVDAGVVEVRDDGVCARAYIVMLTVDSKILCTLVRTSERDIKLPLMVAVCVCMDGCGIGGGAVWVFV